MDNRTLHPPLVPTRCAVVLVNHRSSEHTLACLQSLARLARSPGWVIVADNSPDPEDARRLHATWSTMASVSDQPTPPLLRQGESLAGNTSALLVLPENRGFAAAVNAALRLFLDEPDCRGFWLLNNDTLPAPGALEALCARLNESSAGICGSTMVYADEPNCVQCAAGGIFTPWLAATRHLGRGAPLAQLPDQTNVERTLDYIIGASLLIRREVLERTGLLPEEYFLYCEDVDFCLNARRAGFGLAWAQDSLVLHHEGGSTGAQHGSGATKPLRSRLVDYLAVRNRFHLVRKFRPAALPVALLILPLILANRARREQMDRCGLVLRAVRDALAGRMGKPRGIA